MMKNGNRILTYALVLSLAVHLIFAVVFRPIKAVDAHPEQTPTPVRITLYTPPPPTPTPQPTHPPKITPRSTPATSRQPITHAPTVHSSADPSAPGPYATSGPVTVPPIVAATGAPETPAPPTPTPKPACSVPNVPATTVSVVAPSVPDSVGDIGEAQAQVRVTLEPSGAIEGVQIYRSAGNVSLDREALRAARQSTYRAEVRDCVAVRGDYLFTVDFKE